MAWRYFCLFAIFSYSNIGYAKGLDELSEANPENQEQIEKQSNLPTSSDNTQTGTATIQRESSTSYWDDKFNLSTSFGRAFTIKNNDNWKPSGVTDITLSLKLFQLPDNLNLHGTIRYSPIAITGETNSRMYRGIWEIYNIGGQINAPYKDHINLLSSLELGFVQGTIRPVDGLEPKHKILQRGTNLTFGAGVDFFSTASKKVSVGPRVYMSLGKYRLIQTSAAFSFFF